LNNTCIFGAYLHGFSLSNKITIEDIKSLINIISASQMIRFTKNHPIDVPTSRFQRLMCIEILNLFTFRLFVAGILGFLMYTWVCLFCYAQYLSCKTKFLILYHTLCFNRLRKDCNFNLDISSILHRRPMLKKWMTQERLSHSLRTVRDTLIENKEEQKQAVLRSNSLLI